MFPMITEVAEFDRRARACSISSWSAAATARQAARHREVRVGAMFEVPALAWQLDALLKRVDFLSVGSNDLRQFLFASDRGSPRLADRYDTLSPAMLGMLRAADPANARPAGVPISLCGEMAGHPLDAMALLAIGFRTLSMAAPSIGPVQPNDSQSRSFAPARPM